MSRSDRALAGAAALAGVAGVGVSIYLTVVHYSALPLACPTGGAIGCERVLASPYGVIAGSGLPTSSAGIAWFTISAALAMMPLAGHDSQLIRRLHLVWSAIGLATVLYLVFIEIVALGAICVWCTSAHVLVLLTFLIALSRWQTSSPARLR
jgi:uncharacterized membrane protein